MPRRNTSSASARRARSTTSTSTASCCSAAACAELISQNRRWLIEVGRNGKGPRTPSLTINNVLGVLRACQRGIGVALLPDYLVEENGGLVQLFGEPTRSRSMPISSTRKN